MKNKLNLFRQYAGGLVKFLFTITFLLTLCVGQMWADAYWPYAGFYEVYMTYSYSGNNSNYTFYSSDNNSSQSQDLGTLTADFKVNSLYLKCYKNTNDWGKYGNLCGGLMIYNTGGGDNEYQPTWTITDKNTWHNDYQAHMYEYSKTSCNKVIASYNSGASGSYTAKLAFKMWGSDDNGSDCGDIWWISNNSNNYKFKYKIAPPAISSFSVAESGYLSGTGAENDPYIIPYNGTLTLTVSGSKGRTDANSTIKYWKNSGDKQNSNVLTVTGITSTTKTSVVVHAQCINNSSSSLVGTESTKTVWYKSEAAYSVTVSAGAHGSVSPSGAQSNIGTLSGLSVSATPSTGYNFSTWTISSGSGSFTSTATTASNKFKPTAASTITASFSAKTTTVTLNANAPGGQTVTGGGTTVTATYDATLPSFSALSCTGGYALKGYYDNTSGGNKIINADGSFNANSGTWNRLDGASLALYAQWSLDRTLTYDGNTNTGGSVPADPAVYSNGASVAVLGNTNSLVKTGYTFTGWNTAANGSGASYTAGDNITMNANYTLFAQWSENKTAVTISASPAGTGTFTVGGVSGTSASVGVTTTASIVATAATDFQFTSWATTNCSASPTNTASTTLTGNGSSATGTLTATFTENVASGWYLGGSDFGNSWDVSNTVYPLYKKYRGMDGVFYRSGAVTTTAYDCLHNGTTRYRPTTNTTFNGSGWSNKISLSSIDANANYRFKTAGTYYIIADTRGATPVIWYETSEPDRFNYHSVNVTGVENAKGTCKVTLGSTSGFETTRFANGETFYVTITGVSGYIPTITIGGTPTTWWKEQATYTASGTMSTSDVAVTISYTASYAVTFAKTTGCGTLTATGPDATISTGNKVKSGTSITFTQTATNAGYDFSKWYSTSTGTGGTDLGGNSSGLTKSITAATSVYPIYTTHTWTSVKLDRNGGSTDGAYSVTYLGNAISVTTTPAKTGYQPEGYYTNEQCTTKVATSAGALQANKSGYTNGSSQWDQTTGKTLYTKWQAKQYNITLDKKEGSANGSAEVNYDGTSLTNLSAPTRSGYSVEGYYGETGRTNKVAAANGALQSGVTGFTTGTAWTNDAAGTVTLYTNWSPNSYTISFNADDASRVGTVTNMQGDVTVTFDDDNFSAATVKVPVLTGYTFGGFYTAVNGGGEQIVNASGVWQSSKTNYLDASGNWIKAANTPLYAKWTENTYSTTVAVSPSATGSITSPTPSDGKINISHHTGTAVTATPATDYVFDHWTISGGGLSVSSTTTNPATFKATGTGGTITAYFEDEWNLKGGDGTQDSDDAMGDWDTYNPMPKISDNNYRVSLTLAARTDYYFKIVKRGATRGTGDAFYGKNSGNHFTRGGTTSASGCSTGSGSDYNLHVTTDAAGSYTFTYNTSSNTITVGFPTAYTITFDKGTGGSTITATASASGTLSSGNYVASGEDVTFTQTAQTGYTFSNWYTTKDAGGSVVTGMGASDPVLENVTANKTVYSRYTAHTYQVRFNKNDVGASGTMSNQSFTYDEASKALTSNAFYKDGYSFDYWTTNADGTGTQYTNGQSVRNLSSTNNDVIDLYAHWTEVTITDLTFEPASAAGSTTVTVTPVLSGTPTGTSSICWGLYYDALCTREVPGIEFSASPSAGAASVSFTSPAASGSYYVKATYRTGSACNAGTVLGEPRIEQYVVASKHDLTVKYMCGSTEITSRRMVEIPAASYTLVAPADVFGYTFSSWSAGDGVTITDPTDAEKEEAGLTGVANVKKVTANYDGTLTANYSKKSMILFKNTLNWNKVYVNVYTASKWGVKGAGNQDPNVTVRNQEMSLVPGTTDIYYYECSPTAAYVAFTDRSQDNYEFFSAGTSNPVKVSYPTKPDASGSEDTNYGFNAGTPMFVPLSGQTAQKWNNPGDGDHAAYSNKGYWRKYEPATGKTGYTLEIYNKTPDSSRDTVYTIPMVESTSDGDIFEATVILEANKTGDSKYGVKFRRDNGMRYTKTSGSFAKDGSYSVFTKSPDNYAAYGMETTVAGEYTFRITCANDGTLKMAVKYPASAGDYRLVYTDDVHSLAHPSEIVRKEANGSDIVSFFVREDQSPSIQMQSCSLDGSGNVSWSNYGDAINPASTYESVITEDGVYNFHLAMDEDGALSISKVEPYTGDFYIRTDAVGGTKWADFRNEAHKMKYSDYAAANKGFTHYFVNWVTQNSNVKFTVANDYSPCISDTLVADPIGNVIATIDGGGKMTSANANIRYMYNVKDNSIKRAYIAGAQDNGSHFLVLQGQNGYITDPSGYRLMSANSNNYGVESDATQLADNNEWLYKISVKATPGGKVKLYARYNTVDQYFIGKAAVDDWSTADASEVLISGDGGAQNISVVYDYKTDRMIAAWEPADEINAALTLNADILIVREHQEPATNITFGDAAYSLTTDKTVYGVMRFYRNTLDNRDGDGNILPVADQLPQRERYHYYISFPFDVNVSDIFGFGSYGVHWVLQYYDGKERAKNGLWADPGMTYWKYVPPTGKLNANEGYLLALSPSKMAYGNTADSQVWAKGKSVVELYFPDATMGATIKDDNVTIPALSSDYQCTIWRGEETGTHEGDRNYDRRIADSYWRCIGVPSFKDFNNDLTDGTSAFAWIDPAAYSTGDIHFLYEVQWTDYSLRAVSADNFDFKAMHAYIVQNSTAIVWNHVNAISHSSVVARHRNADEMDNIEFRLELQQNNELVDQTFVRLSDDEAVTTGFEFNHDMSKELYSTKANIYTLIGMEPVAANSLPISTQTTVVPVGIKIAADGDYTFSIPDGTEGIGITLIDNETGIRTSLSALDYTVNLGAGTYNERFVLEISPVQQTPTGIENSEVSHQHSDVRKVLIDGILYIVKDGKMFDATGALVK